MTRSTRMKRKIQSGKTVVFNDTYSPNYQHITSFNTPRYFALIRNNSQGRALIESIRNSFKNSNKTVTVRGRHHDRKSVTNYYLPGRQNDVPVEKAEYFAVYITKNT